MKNFKKSFKTPFKVPFKEAPQSIKSDDASTKQRQIDEISGTGAEDTAHMVQCASTPLSEAPRLPVSGKGAESQGSDQSEGDTQPIQIDSENDEPQPEGSHKPRRLIRGPTDLFADYERELDEEDVDDRRHAQRQDERRKSYSRKFRFWLRKTSLSLV